MHNVPTYIFDICGFIFVAYSTLTKLFAVLLNIFAVLLKNQSFI